MLNKRYDQSDKNPEALVFPSPNSKPIDDHNFSQRIWSRCLKELGIEHRPQYNTRHTFISHFLEKTKDVVKCASLTHGSKSGIQTIYNNYAGIINRVEVPNLF
jgi:integrase